MEQRRWGFLGLVVYVFSVALVLVDLGTKSSRCHQRTLEPILHFLLEWNLQVVIHLDHRICHILYAASCMLISAANVLCDVKIPNWKILIKILSFLF